MSDNLTLTAQRRSEFGKGAARRIRRAHQIPAVLYGHGTDPVHLTLPGHETFLALKGSANALLTLEFDGSSELALAKDVQRHALKDTIDHVDLLLVRRGEKVTVEVPVHVQGESAPGTIHTLDLQTLTIEVAATDIPESIVLDVEGLDDGATIRIADIALPAGATTDLDPESLVLAVITPRATSDDLAADAAEAEAAEAEAAEA